MKIEKRAEMIAQNRYSNPEYQITFKEGLLRGYAYALDDLEDSITVYDTNKWIPPLNANGLSVTVIDNVTGDEIYFSYDEKKWFTVEDGEFNIFPVQWRRKPAVKNKYAEERAKLLRRREQLEKELNEIKIKLA